jgi:hypothetical protein
MLSGVADCFADECIAGITLQKNDRPTFSGLTVTAMLADICIYVVCFLLPGLDLYGALALPDPRESTRKALPLLRHFIVAVAFRTITVGLDIVFGPLSVYVMLKLVCVFALIYGRHYDGSQFIFRRGIRTLASRFPVVVEFAEMSHDATVSRNVRDVVHAAAIRFHAEFERIMREIDG